ncbi:MAG: type II toxin-antitoxin system death-on-curing family toxin, partial [bacterium]|nr:type II toxin-antitoxin system death-on-curing family toxin [bacterium]
MTRYLTFEQLIALHFDIVCDKMGEPFLGVLSENALRAALARPQQAASYEQADLVRQAAFLFHGLSMSHGFVQGNKRTAYVALEWFLDANRVGRIAAPDAAVIEMCLAVIVEHW